MNSEDKKKVKKPLTADDILAILAVILAVGVLGLLFVNSIDDDYKNGYCNTHSC